MNLFYEEYPTTIDVCGESVQIVTDFREYIKLLDMLKDDEVPDQIKIEIISDYFLSDPKDLTEAVRELTKFVTMEALREKSYDCEDVSDGYRKELYSFKLDYPYILSAFLHDYNIDLTSVKYMHWWKFRALFSGLSDNTEVMQRIKYRSIDVSTIRDKEERNRIKKIQRAIMLPERELTDFEIGDVFGQ